MAERPSFESWAEEVLASGYRPEQVRREDVVKLPWWAVATAPFPQDASYKKDHWVADAGKFGMLEVGSWTHRPVPVPCGMSARWALVALCKAVMHGEGPHDGWMLDMPIHEILKMTGKDHNGGGRDSSTDALRRAFVGLLECKIEHTEGLVTSVLSPVNRYRRDPHGDPLRTRIWGVNPVFVKSVNGGVPVNLEVLRQVGPRDAKTWDLLLFLTWRVRGVQRRTVIRWEWLLRQLGSSARNKRVVKQRMKESLRRVKFLCPGLTAEAVSEGIALDRSNLPELD